MQKQMKQIGSAIITSKRNGKTNVAIMTKNEHAQRFTMDNDKVTSQVEKIDFEIEFR